MGSFIMCAAFIDALACAYAGGGDDVSGRDRWSDFMERYFGRPYERLWDSYGPLRCLLLHNYSAKGVRFTSSEANAGTYLLRVGDDVILYREDFVRDVRAAYEAFASDVRDDEEIRARVFGHLEQVTADAGDRV
jgi:hypothetical protein